MKNLIKADFKKTFYLPSNRYLLLSTICISFLLGIFFLFTINVTQGKVFTELSGIEVIDITLLGMDAAAIMLIIFTALYINKDLSSGAIHTNLAITPVRGKYFLSKISFISLLAILISVLLLSLFLSFDLFIISINDMGSLSLFNMDVFTKAIGSVVMVLFYSLISAAGTFYLQSTAGGIAFSLGVMFLPALIKMFPSEVSDILLPIFPEASLNVIFDIQTTDGSLVSAIAVLLLWNIISKLGGLWKFKRIDY